MERIFPFCQCFDIGAKEAKHCRVIQKDSIWGTTYLPKRNRSMNLMKLEHYNIQHIMYCFIQLFFYRKKMCEKWASSKFANILRTSLAWRIFFSVHKTNFLSIPLSTLVHICKWNILNIRTKNNFEENCHCCMKKDT